MAKYPNQRTVEIHSSSGRNNVQKPYGLVTREELKQAIRVLDDKRSGTPIMLYLALTLNCNGYPLDFSPAALENDYGVSADRWRNAFKVLEEKGYLTKGDKNHYTFESNPMRYQEDMFMNTSNGNSDAEDDLSWISEEGNTIGDIPWMNPDEATPAEGESNNKYISLCNENPMDNKNDSLSSLMEYNTPVEGERNNKNNKNIPEDYDYWNLFRHDDTCNNHPEYDAVIKKKVEIEGLIETIRTEFGHIESVEMDLKNAEKVASEKPRGFSRATKHIEELKRLLCDLRAAKQ